MQTQEARSDGPTGVQFILFSVLVTAAYAIVGLLTLTIGQSAGLASPLWPAAGIAFAVVYAWGWRMAPAVLVGSMLANSITLLRQDAWTMESLWVTLAVGGGVALQAMVGASLVTRTIGRRAALASGGQIIIFLLLAGPASAVVSSSIATFAQVSSGLLSTDQALLTWVTWWAGDAIGIVVFAPLTLMALPEQGEVWSGRRLKVAIPGLIGTLIFLAIFFQTDHQLKQDREERLAVLASEASSILETEVSRHQEVLEGLASFFEASQQVDADEFATYANDALSRFPNLQALSWNPIISADDLDSFERFQRDTQGFIDYRVTQRSPDGELVAVTSRPEYIPVAYIEPLASNLPALGFDINSNPVRRIAINEARLLGKPAATAPIDLVQETGEQKGMLALVPVFESGIRPDDPLAQAESLKGFAVGVYRLGDLLSDSFEDPAWDSVEINVVDVTAEGDPQEVATREAVTPATVDQTTNAESISAEEQFNVYGQTWQIVVTPTSGDLAIPNRAIPPGIDVLALIVLLLLQAFVLLVTGLERASARQAEEADREANTDELTRLHNRRSFLRNLERIRDRSIAEGSPHALLYIDLDGFKSVNDQGGHEAGDHLLQDLARTLENSVRSRDIVARIGGDEFAIILNNCGLDRGVAIADSLVTAISAVSVEGPHGALSVGASIGVTVIDSDEQHDIDDFIRTADDACYEAKRSGGGVRVAHRDAST